MLKRLVRILAVILSFCIPLTSFGVVRAADVVPMQQSNSKIVISEIQTGGLDGLNAEDGKMEFLELHNQTDAAVNVTGWRVEYFSSTRLDVNDVAATPTRQVFLLNGQVDAYGYVLLSYENYVANADGYFGQGSTSTSGLLARTGGHLRIVDDTNTITDIVGWGTAKMPETKAIPEIKPGFATSRFGQLNNTDVLVDTDNNFTDFVNTNAPTPQGGSLQQIIIEEPEPQQATVPPCDGLAITEILPNPNGVDTGNEYIELYNPGLETIKLQDCILKTSGSTKVYVFDADDEMAPGSYRALYSSVTGLVLANAAGGSVTIIGTTADFTIQYPADMGPDHSWSIVGGIWYDTSVLTPNLPNLLPAANAENAGDEEVLAPCPEGKYRNPETNRCRNIQPVTTALTPCAVGQVRNSQTNRCRNVTAVLSSLVPCRAGQQRNPETNRCRNVLAASTTPTPCKNGYERNPETNRCRKIAEVVSKTSPTTAKAAEANTPSLNNVFMLIAALGVVGYGLYEYRREAAGYLGKMKAKLFKSSIK